MRDSGVASRGMALTTSPRTSTSTAGWKPTGSTKLILSGLCQSCKRKQFNRCKERSSWYSSWCQRVWQWGRRRCMHCESDSDSLDSISERSDLPSPFCHTDFINQKEVIEHMEICSRADPEPKVLQLICPCCKQTFETYYKIEKHIGIHIMR